MKFRIWDKETKYLDYDVRITSTDKYEKVEVLDAFSEWREIEDNYHVLMRNTGLKDKNGNEIYEGDICRWTDPEAFEGEIISYIFVVRYSDEYLKWIGENNNLYDDLYDFTDDRQLELIGNIYETPELLNEVEE